MGKLLSGVGKIASVAAPFIPGIGGAIAGIAGGLSGQAAAQGKANQYAGQIGNVGSALSALGGIDPKTGKFNPNYNPNAEAAQTLFDPAQLTGSIVGNREAIDRRADNTVSANIADALGRGFGTNDTALTAANSDARAAQGIAEAGFARSSFDNLLAQKNRFLADGLGQRQGALQAALGSFGGLQGIYASDAAGISQGIGGAIGGLSKGGGFDLTPVGDWFKARLGIGKRKQSTSIGTTNAQTPSRNGLGRDDMG